MTQFTFPLNGNSQPPWQLGSAAKAVNFAKRSLQRPWSMFGVPNGIELDLRSGVAPRKLTNDELAVVFVTHNNMRFIPSFLAHYRSLGKVRFICVDDQSTDQTVELLLSQPDVDIYSSNVRFKDASRGKIWREMLFAYYGHGRWYLSIDSDEYFVYETMASESINDYTRRLDSTHVRRVPAPMLDLYPLGDLSRAAFTGADGVMPWHVATHFDADGYKAQAMSSALSIYGGVRARAFNAWGELMKYPLTRWDGYCSMGRTIHRPRPAYYNFAPVMGALLHFKIFSDIKEMAIHAVAEGQHYRDAKIYRAVLNKVENANNLDLSYSGSIPYRGIQDLIDRGFVLAQNSRRG